MQSIRLVVAAVLVIAYGGALGFACSKKDEATQSSDSDDVDYSTSGPGAAKPAPPKAYAATATLLPTTDGGTVEGTVDFVEKDGETTVTVDIGHGGFPSAHGLHIFEHGSCDAADGGPAFAAGGHWNPTDAGHGLPTSTDHHAGDLGNVDIDYTGKGTKTLTSKDFYVRDGELSVIGRAVILHEWPDDGVSPIDGNSGPRSGCGVIQPSAEDHDQ